MYFLIKCFFSEIESKVELTEETNKQTNKQTNNQPNINNHRPPLNLSYLPARRNQDRVDDQALSSGVDDAKLLLDRHDFDAMVFR